MASCQIRTLVFLCSCYYLTSSCSPQEIHIAPSDAGYQNPYTINHFCQDTSAISDTVVSILNGTHRLNTTCDIKNANNVTLQAQHGTKVVITCEDCGFRLLNFSQLRILDIEFRGCGAAWNASKFDLDLLHGLVFVNGSNLHVVNMRALFRGLYIENVAGNVFMNFCEVSNTNRPFVIIYDTSVTTDVIVNLTNLLISDNNVKTGSALLQLRTSKVSLLFESMTFRNNTFTLENGFFYFGDLALVTISNSTFSDCSSCMVVFIETDKFNKSEKNLVHPQKLLRIVNSNFVHNKAGCLLVTWSEKSQYNGHVLIEIVNTKFIHNDNAIYLAASDYVTGLTSKISLIVAISDCAFTKHFYNKYVHNAVITAHKVPFLILERITVESNSYSGIHAAQSTIIFSGSSKIANNSGLIGGGLKIVSTRIFLDSNTDLVIKDNLAQKTGGGIQIETSQSNCKVQCLYDYLYPGIDPGTVNFTVSNNHALDGGDNIFGIYDDMRCPNFLHVEPPNSISANSSVSSRPFNISWSGNQCRKTDYCLIEAYPGKKTEFQVLLLGANSDMNNHYPLVSGSVSATVYDVAIKELEKIQKVGLSGSNVSYTLYSTKSNEPSIVVQPTDSSCLSQPVVIQIYFLDCSLGFSLTEVDDGKFECRCAFNIQTVSNCSIQTQTITKRKDSWLGKYDLNNHSYLATSDNCPFDYCKSTFQDIRSDNSTLYQDEQCQYNRTGILCGSCPEGWSLVLGSSECREECSNVWLFLIVPFAIAGLLLVVVIHFLNLTVTMGTVSGLIFYANVIQDYSVTLLSKYSIPGLTPILHIFLFWLNLDLGISTCFYHGMEAFSKIILLFVFPAYIWLISATIIVLSNRYIFFTRLVGENAVKVLSTLFLLSYSKIFHAVIDTLKVNLVEVYFNDSSTSSEMRWAVDGNIPYFDPQRHLALFLVALFFIFLLLPFTMSLLCIRHVYSLSNYSSVFLFVDRLKPFFDTYTGPFKDRASFWTGLLLFVRLVLIIVHTVDYADYVIPYYFIVAVCFILSAIMIFLRGVYKRQSLNILEYFFILNIGAIFLVNSYKGGPDSWKSIFTHLLVSSSFLAFLGIIVYHTYLLLSPHCRRRFQSSHQIADNDVDELICEGMRGYQPVQQDLDTFTE